MLLQLIVRLFFCSVDVIAAAAAAAAAGVVVAYDNSYVAGITIFAAGGGKFDGTCSATVSAGKFRS